MSRAGAKLLGGILLIGLVLLILKWALITAAILVVPFGAWWLWDRGRTRRAEVRDEEDRLAVERRRQEVESRATIDAAGGCGWCGARIAHRDELGALVYPVDFHRAEIDEQIRARPVG